MSDFRSLLDISRYPSVPLIDVEPGLAKADNVGNTFNLNENNLLPFAFNEPRVSTEPFVVAALPWSQGLRHCSRRLTAGDTSEKVPTDVLPPVLRRLLGLVWLRAQCSTCE